MIEESEFLDNVFRQNKLKLENEDADLIISSEKYLIAFTKKK